MVAKVCLLGLSCIVLQSCLVMKHDPMGPAPAFIEKNESSLADQLAESRDTVEPSDEDGEEFQFCTDTIYGNYLKSRYIASKQRELQRFRSKRSRNRRARWHKVEANHYARHTLAGSPTNFEGGFPVVTNPQVEKWLSYFKTRGRSHFMKWLIRAESHRDVIMPILRSQGMPKELFYLAMIESGLSNHAYSRASATGAWQFMKGTAKLYGLKVNYWVDERRDPLKATVAAAAYLRDLYSRFGDWYLAMAAYNAGPGKVNRAIRRLKTKDFWTIAESRYLRTETKQYVPKMLAALLIATDPDAYGFQVSANPKDQTPTTGVVVDRPVRLSEVAEKLGVPFEEFKRWNPELIRAITPPTGIAKNYTIRMPETLHRPFVDIAPTLAELEIKDVKMHKVRRGETLSSIARKYRIRIHKLKEYNPKLRPRRMRVGNLIAVPMPNAVVRPRKNSV